MPLQFPQSPEKLTPTERRLLEFIESHREEFLFMTIGQLSADLGVSEATISRFARHLGCQDFKQLKNLVLAQNHLEGPAGKLARTVLADGEFDPRRYLMQQQACLQKTMEALDPAAFEDALEALLCARRIFIQAKSASAAMGQLLFFRLRRLGLPVELLPGSGTELLEGLVQAGERDLVIFFGFSKVSAEGRMILRRAGTARYRTLCFTGRLHPPAEERADLNLYVYRGTEKEYHSMTAAAALVDTLVVAASQRLGADGAARLKELHRMKQQFGG